MKSNNLFFILVSSLFLTACGGTLGSVKKSSNEMSSGNTSQEDQDFDYISDENVETFIMPQNKMLTIGQNCQLSAYSLHPQEKYDFQYSNHPVIKVYERHIAELQLENFNDLEDQNEAIDRLLGNNRPLRIDSDISAAPVCTFTYPELKNDILSGSLPLDELLNKHCPFLTSLDLLAQVDTAKELELVNKIKDLNKDGSLDEDLQTHKILLSDSRITGSAYMGMDLKIKRESGHVFYEPMMGAVAYEAKKGFMDTVNYNGAEQRRCDYAFPL